MDVLSNTGADDEWCTDRIRRICHRCHADGGMVPDYTQTEIDASFVSNVVSNFQSAGHINNEVAKDCIYLAEEVCRFRFFLALRWQRRCDDPPSFQETIENCCLQRPTSTTLAHELMQRILHTAGNIEATDQAVRQWAEAAYKAELIAFATFESQHRHN